MNKVTLDNNCIIDLEKSSIHAPHLRRLVEMHDDKKIKLRIIAISASEQRPDKTYVFHFNDFRHRLAIIGLGNVEILNTILYVGLGFVGYSLVGGGKLEELERKIQRIMFPTIELQFKDFCKKRSLKLDDKKAWHRRVNKKCDVLTLWSHIWYEDDIFVTRDTNFHRKAERLIKLGAGKILTPVETLMLSSQDRFQV